MASSRISYTEDTLLTPPNLKRWRWELIPNILSWPQFCHHSHILSNCPTSLPQGRYVGRCDSVLQILASFQGHRIKTFLHPEAKLLDKFFCHRQPSSDHLLWNSRHNNRSNNVESPSLNSLSLLTVLKAWPMPSKYGKLQLCINYKWRWIAWVYCKLYYYIETKVITPQKILGWFNLG